MLHKLFASWKPLPTRRLRRQVALKKLNSFESLEARAMLTATPVGEELLVNESFQASQRIVPESADVAVSENGQAVVVYHGRGVTDARLAGDDREVFVQRYDDTGTAVGTPTLANEVTRGDQFDPSTGAAADGSYWVVWSGRGVGDRFGIFARRFDSGGTALTDSILVNETIGGVQSKPDVAVTADGQAIVVWQGVGSGDFDGIFGRILGSDGTPANSEFLINTDTLGEQAYPAVAVDDNSEFVVTWSSRQTGTADWDVLAQQFNANGSTKGVPVVINTTTDGSQVGSDVGAAADGSYVVTWSSFGQDGDGWGVFAQQMSSGSAQVGSEIAINAETAGHQQDADIAVAANGEFVVAWSSGVPDGSGWEADGRTFASDGSVDGDVFDINRDVSGADSGHQRFPVIDVNDSGASFALYHGNGGADHNGVFAQQYSVDVGPVANVAPQFAQLPEREIVVGETLSVELAATDDNRSDVLTYTIDDGPDSATITRIDDRTSRLEWTPTEADRNTQEGFRIIVTDDGDPALSAASQFIVRVTNSAAVVDLSGPASAGNDFQTTMAEGVTRIAAVSPDLTVSDADQPQLSSATITLRNPTDATLESLFVDTTGTAIMATFDQTTSVLRLAGDDSVENYQRVLRTLEYENLITNRRGIDVRIGIVVSDGTDDSAEVSSTISVQGLNSAPTLQAIQDVNLLSGSPLHIPLVASDLDGDTLEFTITSSNPGTVDTFVPEGNRSARITVDGFGEMVFELFEGRASRATSRIISLANEGFYEDIIFHRVVEDFVIQAGDPTATGSGGSTRPDFDDQFHPDLQHNRDGILSMAKSLDDTNDSQFFITAEATRFLDSQHTVFGQLITGDDVRANINATPVDGSDRPLMDATISSFEIFTDNQNGVLMLSAPEGTTGSETITVVVTDGNGGTATQTFNVNVTPDTENSPPYLEDIDLGGLNQLQTAVDTPTTLQLTAVDVEGDSVLFLDEQGLLDRNQFVTQSAPADLDVSVDPTTGLVTITPMNGLRGQHSFTVAVAAADRTFFPSPNQQASGIDYQVVDILIGPEDA